MGKYCPKVNKDVVYITCQECDEKMCEMELHPSCSTCCHKHGNTVLFNREAVTCKITNEIIFEHKIQMNGCPNHNKDLSKENICLNCQHFLGGGDWGLSCSADYYKLTTHLSPACQSFKRKEEKL